MFGFLVLASPAVWAEDFPPITDAERALSAVPGQEGAPAVVIYDRGDLRFGDPSLDEITRFQTVRREKILTPEGLDRAQISVYHSSWFRLLDVEARAVLPDGRVLVAGDDAVFEEQLSKFERQRLRRVVIPGVEVGAILDIRVTYSLPSLVSVAPWTFGTVGVPTLRSEITFHQPEKLGLRFWGLETTARKIQREESVSVHGQMTRAWMENLPPIPDEPYSFPTADLASKFQAIPIEGTQFNSIYPLWRDWQTVVGWRSEEYREFRKSADDAKAKGKEIARSHASQRARAEAAYRFIRDGVRTSGAGLGLSTTQADQVLASGAGRSAEVALLLEAVLDGAKLDPELVWLADRFHGRFDPSVAVPRAFDAVAVAVSIDGEEVLLDPSSPALALGRVSPRFEGMPALRVVRKAPIFPVPASPAADNGRHAVVEWRLDPEGRWLGTGSLRAIGSAAWRLYQVAGAAAGEVAAIERVGREQLEASFADFRVEALETVLAEGRVEFRFELVQREETVLGDEASLWPAAPLATAQRFALPPAQRRTPVQTVSAFADRVETSVRWPEGWSVAAMPAGVDVAGAAGAYRFVCSRDDAARTARCERHFEQASAEYFSSAEYRLLRQLDEDASGHDGQAFVLMATP